ncbi:MAG TPA: hypothetical protein VEZ26_09305 [Sphingomonadaceae bacterium]|nr:hypothetical protein [Sphingomonadaceae bacterium]
MSGVKGAELAALLDANAKAVDLLVPQFAREGVLLNLRILMGHAERVMAFELPHETALAVDFAA